MAGFLDGLGSSLLGGLQNVGDFIGMDGAFGMGNTAGGGNLSLANMGEAFGGLLGDSKDPAAAWNNIGANTDWASGVPSNVASNSLATSLGQNGAKGIIGDMGLKDLLGTGIAGYQAMNSADLAKNQISLANQAYADQKALSDRNIAKQDDYDKMISSSYAASKQA